MNLRLITAATLAALTFAGTGFAQEQPWLADRRVTEGMGYRVGDVELHWGAAAEGGYDSNYFLRDDDEFGGPIAVWRLRLTPSFSVSTLSQRRRESVAVGAAPALNFRAGVWASYNELIPSDAPEGEDDEVRDQRHVDIGANARFDILPQRPVGADLHADYLRTGEPSNVTVTEVAFDRDTVRGGAGVSWRPGGGLFDWRLGYEIAYNWFEKEPFQIYNNFEHGILTRGRWRFLPRTAILFDGEYKFVRYTQDDTPQTDGDYVQARVGLNGLITSKLAFLALLGWNSSYYEPNGIYEAQNYDGYVAHGELKWFLLPPPSENSATVGLSSIAAGYLRNFSNSYLGSFYVRDRGYLNFSYFAGGVFVAMLEGGYSHLGYPESTYTDSMGDVGTAPAFGQDVIDGRLFGEFRFSEVFGVNATLLYEQVISPQYPSNLPANGDPDETEDLDYSRWQAWLGIRYFI
jgi:hypothetical protein